MVADRRHRRSASPPCWRPACSSGASSSPCPPTRPRSRSSASNGSGASGCPARTASSAHPTPATSPPTIRSASIPDDPERPGRRHRRGGDLHLPVGKPVKMLLRSIDVLHDFYVPEFRAKMDMIPGSVTYFWFTPTRTGTFEVLCAELCGTATPSCAASSWSTPQEDYQAWLRRAADIRAADGAAADGRGRRRPSEMNAARLRATARRGSQRSSPPKSEEVFRWSMSHLARSTPSRPPKSRKSSSIIRTAGGRNTSSPRTPRSSPSSIR